MKSIAILVVAFAVSWAGTAAAQADGESPPGDPLDRARELARAFELEQAIAALEPLVEDDGRPLPRRVEALALTARFHIDLGQEAAAREAFGRLLRLDPAHELNQLEYPPAVRDLLDQIRQGLPAADRPSVEVTVDEQVTMEGDVTLSASLSGDLASVHGAQASYRGEGETAYREAAMAADGIGFRVTLVPPEGAAALEYHLEVQAPSGYVLGRAGAADSPIRLALGGTVEPDPDPDPGLDPDPPGPRWYVSWWFWTIVGVVVAGGTAAGIVAATLPGEVEQGSFATMHLP